MNAQTTYVPPTWFEIGNGDIRLNAHVIAL